MILSSILLFSDNPHSLADFYHKMLEKDPVMGDQNYTTFEVGQIYITIGPHDKVKGRNNNPERILLNFEVADVQAEFERVKDLGGKVIEKPYTIDENDEYWIATLADPDGNYLQLVSPFKTYSS